jgi:hypothetical protein
VLLESYSVLPAEPVVPVVVEPLMGAVMVPLADVPPVAFASAELVVSVPLALFVACDHAGAAASAVAASAAARVASLKLRVMCLLLWIARVRTTLPTLALRLERLRPVRAAALRNSAQAGRGERRPCQRLGSFG